ncbi:MAG: hypothetical protein L3J97_06675, partial [Thermoplasmata archaeon]|nr:hypothetical protein [Thermoplasmata archaeon]
VSAVPVDHAGSASSDFADCSSVRFLVYHVGRSRIILARKLGSARFVQAVAAVYDAARLTTRSALEGRTMCPALGRSLFSGIRAGARAPLSAPARFSGVSPETPVDVVSGIDEGSPL